MVIIIIIIGGRMDYHIGSCFLSMQSSVTAELTAFFG